MTTTTTASKKITVRLSEAPPVTLDLAKWPRIARASDHDGKVECQANTEWYITVRQHADGRRLVYGAQEPGNGGQFAGTRNPFAGYLLTPAGLGEPGYMVTEHSADDFMTQTIRAIRRVAGVIGRDDLGAECIADLPAVEL